MVTIKIIRFFSILVVAFCFCNAKSGNSDSTETILALRPPDPKPNCFIKNETSSIIKGIWVTTSDSRYWGENCLSSEIATGKTKGIYESTPLNNKYKFDILLRTSSNLKEGVAYLKKGYQIAHLDTLRFTDDDLTVFGKTGPAGGLIFYDKENYEDGWRYLEVAPVKTEFSAEWGIRDIFVSQSSREIGAGKENTLIIKTLCDERGEKNTASQICLSQNINDYKDWFLPSIYELRLIYRYLHCFGLGDFGKSSDQQSWYWSSTQHGYSFPNAWAMNFGQLSGTHSGFDLSERPVFRVRSIRSF